MIYPVKVVASKFLLSWLFQHEHEHRQWSAAIAVGVISSCLHLTDRQHKLQCMNGLLEVDIHPCIFNSMLEWVLSVLTFLMVIELFLSFIVYNINVQG